MTPLEIRLRSLARRLGVTRLLRSHWGWRARWHRRVYERTRPDRLALGANGWQVTMLIGSASEYAMLLSKKEDYALLRLLGESLPPGGCYWDVGSSLGFYAVVAARMVGEAGQVVAFEPEPRSRERLQQNIAANGLRNVRVLPMALGRRAGALRLAVEEVFSAGSHRVLAEGAPGGGRIVDVEVVTGDGLLRSASPPLPVPDVIKIDVEGAELDVLAGLEETLRDPRCRAVLCEVHFAILEERGLRDGPLEAERVLRGCGFETLRWADRSHLLATK